MSTLPDIRPLLPSWGAVETWAGRFFLFLGILTLFPWILLVLFDASLYVWRYLILAPIASILYPGALPPETQTMLEESEEISTTTATPALVTARTSRKRALQGSETIPVANMGDGLDKAWRKDA